MTNDIRKLDKSITDLISAGEVIEAPAGVVKELTENAIDALAQNIVIEIENGGKTYIRVTDDGNGIKKEQIPIAFEKYATSKIANYDDFINVKTNGFRGEALFSIAAVSITEIITRTDDEKFGIKAKMVQNKIKSQETIGANKGTTIIVKDLFYNTPVRKKFLKSAAAETRKITDYVIKYALSNPDVSFKFINNKKTVFQTFGGGLKEAVNILFKGEYDHSLLFVDENIEENLFFSGALGSNDKMLSSRRGQYIFVNSRIIEDKHLTNAAEAAYRRFVPKGAFPVFIINLKIKPSLTDVNIHPSKLNIKFSSDLDIYQKLTEFISNKLASLIMIPEFQTSKQGQEQMPQSSAQYNFFEDYKYPNLKENTLFEEFQKYRVNPPKIPKDTDTKKTDTVNEYVPISFDINSKDNLNSEFNNNSEIQNKETDFIDLSYYEYVGRFFKTYILMQLNDEAIIIDQHAAHERVLFERFLKQYRVKKLHVQVLLEPIKKNVPFSLMNYIETFKEILSDSGFNCEVFGDNILLIRGIPDMFTIEESENYIQNVLDLSMFEDIKSAAFHDIIATKACKAAIKGGQISLKEEEIHSLIADLNKCENKFACPHGRPVIIRLKKTELEKMFKRVL